MTVKTKSIQIIQCTRVYTLYCLAVYNVFLRKFIITGLLFLCVIQVVRILSCYNWCSRWINDEFKGPDLMPMDKDLRDTVEVVLKNASGVGSMFVVCHVAH